MEKGDIGEGLIDKVIKGEVPQESCNFQLRLEELPQYQKAAEQTGFNVSTIAREGQDYTFWVDKGSLDPSKKKTITTNEKVQRTTKIQPGMVAISIEPPKDQKDFAPFWNAYKALNQPPIRQKG